MQVTKPFQDVFSSNHSNLLSYDDETKRDLVESEEDHFIGRQQPSRIKAEDVHFNFELLFAGLHENLISNTAFTKESKRSD